MVQNLCFLSPLGGVQAPQPWLPQSSMSPPLPAYPQAMAPVVTEESHLCPGSVPPPTPLRTCIISTRATRSASEMWSPVMNILSCRNFSSKSCMLFFTSASICSVFSAGTSSPVIIGISIWPGWGRGGKRRLPSSSHLTLWGLLEKCWRNVGQNQGHKVGSPLLVALVGRGPLFRGISRSQQEVIL